MRLPPRVELCLKHAFDETWRAKDVFLSGSTTLLKYSLRTLSYSLLRHQTPSVVEFLTLKTIYQPTGGVPPAISSSDLFGGQNPKLKYVSLQGLSPPWPYPSFGSNVRRLSLRFEAPRHAQCLPPSYDELFAWLGTLPLLEHIELENALPANTLVPKTQYRLLNLRDIIIWARPSAVMGPFEALLLPSPNRVQIIWGNIYTRVDDARIEAQHFSRLSSSSLSDYDVTANNVLTLAFKPIRFLKVVIDVDRPITIDAYSSLVHWPVYDAVMAAADVCQSQTHFTLQTISYSLFVDAIYSLMTIIKTLHVSNVEVLLLRGPRTTHRARTHYLHDARPFSAVHTVVLETTTALVLFLDMHVAVWKSGVPDPDCDAYNVIFPSLRRIILLEVDAEPDLKARFLGYLEDCQERGNQLEELRDEGIRGRVVDLEWFSALKRVVHKHDWK